MSAKLSMRLCAFCGQNKVRLSRTTGRCISISSSVRQNLNPLQSHRVHSDAQSSLTSEQFLQEVATKPKRGQHHWLLNTKSWEGKLSLVELLLENVVFQNDSLLGINKPHDLPMQSAKDPLTIRGVLPELKERLGLDYLEIGVSLDRLHSGVVLLCKTPEMKARLKKHMLTCRSQIQPFKTFWAITMGIPTSPEGTETIPIAQEKVGGYYLSVSLENYSRSSVAKGSVVRPTMKYKTLSTNRENDCALVELQPTTTKWDFIQLFLTQQMSAILGDHMYSSRVKSILGRTVLVDPHQAHPRPQSLPDDTRLILGIDKEYQEWIPLHLHCARLTVPYSHRVKRRTVDIKATVPSYFSNTAQLLGLDVPSFRDLPSHDQS